jgi:hypothetical protein
MCVLLLPGCYSRGSAIRPVNTRALALCFQDKKQRELLETLAEQFFAVQKQYRLPVGDFPPLARFKEVAAVSVHCGLM